MAITLSLVYKQVISRVFLVIALLLITNDAAEAGPYILAMSKDKALCESMLGLYNKDMDTYGRINYDSHEIFSKIQWQEVDDLNKPLHTHVLRAFLDINNDGKDELVIKQTWTKNYLLEESLYIFPSNSDVLSKLKPGQGGMKALFDDPNMIFSYKNIIYYLKDLPDSLQEKILEYKFKRLSKKIKKINANEVHGAISKAYIGGSFVLQPFIWHGTTYISMTDRNPEWIVVGKYKQTEEVQDICYFYDQSHRFINY